MSLFEGRASALFVILAGIGISLMTRSSVARNESNPKINKNSARFHMIFRLLEIFIFSFLATEDLVIKEIAERSYGNGHYSYLF
jgi:cell division protein FtsW (lipid II flippase)